MLNTAIARLDKQTIYRAVALALAVTLVACGGTTSAPVTEQEPLHETPTTAPRPTTGSSGDTERGRDLELLCELPPSGAVTGSTSTERRSAVWSYWRENVRSNEFVDRFSTSQNELDFIWVIDTLAHEGPAHCPMADQYSEIVEPPKQKQETGYTDHVRQMMRQADWGSCYNARLKRERDSKPAGEIMVRYTIASDGHVSDASISESSLPRNAKFDTCIVDVLQDLQFRSHDDGIVIINYPLSFSTD